MFLAALARLIQEALLLFHHGKEPDATIPEHINMLRRLFRQSKAATTGGC